MELEGSVRGLLAAGEADAAATAAIEEVGPSVFRYLRALHGDDNAEDILSRWREDLWRGLPRFRFECPLRVWAFRLAWNASVRFQRNPWQLRRRRLGTTSASLLAASVTRETALKTRDERLRKLERLRQGLDGEESTLLILRLDRQMSWEEISAILSKGSRPLRPATLRKRYERLKDRLARKARHRGLLR